MVLQQSGMPLASDLSTTTPRSPTGTELPGTGMPAQGLGSPLPTSIGLPSPPPVGGGSANPLPTSSNLLPPTPPVSSNLLPPTPPASGADSSPRIGLGQEQFRSAATWQNILSNPSSNASTLVVREYGGKRRLASMHGKHLGLPGEGVSLFWTCVHAAVRERYLFWRGLCMVHIESLQQDLCIIL